MVYLHERSGQEGDDNHRHPRGHLGESPCNICVGKSQVVLLERTVEGMEDSLVWLNLLNLVVDDELLDGLGGGRRAVQGLVADSGNWRRLVGKRLGDLEVVDRGRADGP